MPTRHPPPCSADPRCPHRQPCPHHGPAEQHERDAARRPGGRRAHYGGTYRRRAAAITAAANANPATRCRRCNRTMAEIHDEHPAAIWTAGHLVKGQVDGDLAPECSPCNYAAGGRGDP